MTNTLTGKTMPLNTKGNRLPTQEMNMICTVCQKHRANLRPRKSKLTGGPMVLCNACFEGKLEPRWAVILVARDPKRGLADVRDYIRNHKYNGEKIRAEEILPLS